MKQILKSWPWPATPPLVKDIWPLEQYRQTDRGVFISSLRFPPTPLARLGAGHGHACAWIVHVQIRWNQESNMGYPP